MLKNKIILYNSILISFIPLALISGPFISDLFLVISSISILFLIINGREFKYLLNIFSYIFFSYCLFIIISSLLSSNLLLSLEASLFYCRFGFFTISIWYLLDNFENFKKFFFAGLISSFLILLVDGYIQYIFDYNTLGWLRHGDRLSSFFGDEYIMGSFFSRLFPLLVALFIGIFNKNSKIILFTFIILILVDVIIFLSGERVAFLNITLCTILIIFLFNNYKILRLISFIISILIILFLTFYDQSIKIRMIDKTYDDIFANNEIQNNTSDKIDQNKINLFSPTHEAIYLVAFDIFRDNYLIGSGPKTFREECKNIKYSSLNGCSTHPHNILLQSLSETGIIGFIFYIGVFFSITFFFLKIFISKILKNSNSRKYTDDYFIALLIAVFVNLFPFFPSGNFYNNWISIIYFLPVGFIIQFHYKNVNN